MAVQRIIIGSMYHRFASRFLFWLSSLTNPKIKVRVFFIWRVSTLAVIIWMYSTGSICAPGSTVTLMDLTIWSALWTTTGYPEPIDTTNFSCTCCGLSEESVDVFLTALSETVVGKNIVTYLFQNSDKFSIGSPLESSIAPLVDMLDCFAEYFIYIFNWNISIERFVRAIERFYILSTSSSVHIIYKYCKRKTPCRRF